MRRRSRRMRPRTTIFPIVITGLLAVSGCGGSQSGDTDGAAQQAAAKTTAVSAPPLPITIESPGEQATVRGERRGSSRVVARVRLVGTAEPGRRLLVDGRCAAAGCTRRLTVDDGGAWSSRLRLVLPSGTRRRTVRVTYAGGTAAAQPARVGIRIKVPRQSVFPEASLADAQGGSLQAPQTPAAGQTTTLPSPSSAPAGAGGLVIIGDSLAEGMKSYLPAAFPGWSVQVDSRVGRPLAEGMAILGQTRLAPRTTLAISLFTNNDPWRTAELEAAVRETLRRVGPSGCAIWATIAAPPINGMSYDKANELLNRMASGSSRLRIVPWAAQMATTPGVLSGDGVHPTPAGYELRARMYAQAADSCAR